MNSTATIVRSAFKVGMVVQWHPDAVTGEESANDRGVVFKITDGLEGRHPIVSVVWDRVLNDVPEWQQDKVRLSDLAEPIVSARLRRTFTGHGES